MGTIRKNIVTGDNLSGKTIIFDFSHWETYTTSNMGTTDLIYVDDEHKIYSSRMTLFSNSETVYLKDGEGDSIAIARLTDEGLTINYDSYTLSSDFGIVQSITGKNKAIYKSIYHDVPLLLIFNGNDIEKLFFNRVEINNVYFNGNLVF